jgi:MSHA biogenesis protein MshE
MAGLDVAEVRMPQDGSFSLNVSDRELDVRLSTMPIQDGESIVMRLLDQSKGLLSLEVLGMPEQLTTRFRHQVKRPHGMVLVTGPTGSGKTTTIYAALNERNNPGEKIITVEDPVEYKLPRVNQVEINPQIGLDFNAVLRSVLRQDPDVILIGEIRDEESMDMGLRSAMTGHLVFSTLHTNDAVSTVSRMIEMGGQGYLLAATLKLVVAQRLVRRVCPHCQKKQVLESYEQEWVDLVFKEEDIVHAFLKGSGCASCEHTGYRGRIGVFEVIEIDHELKGDLNREDMNAFEQHVRGKENYHSLIDGAKELLLTGATSVEEVMRVMDDVSLL